MPLRTSGFATFRCTPFRLPLLGLSLVAAATAPCSYRLYSTTFHIAAAVRGGISFTSIPVQDSKHSVSAPLHPHVFRLYYSSLSSDYRKVKKSKKHFKAF